MAAPQDRGRAAEALAAAYLELIGYQVVARNLRLGGVEVDLVADDGPVRVIVEGESAHTTVHGEKCVMSRGDLILTPTGL